MKEHFQEVIKRLREQRKELDHKIEALLVAERLLAPQPKKKLDKQAMVKTVNFVKKRRGPTTPAILAKAFHISVAAAAQRLTTAQGKGEIAKVKRGVYAARI